jgi:predicted N-acetyltransferase YhbS
MDLILRPGRPADANACGVICYEAFKAIAEPHGFPPDFPSPEAATDLMNYILTKTKAYSLIAEKNGKVVGSNFLWEDTRIAGIGPITIDPKEQNASVGRKLMEGALKRVEEQRLAAVRLVQAAYHNRSLSLYSKLGFEVKEPLSVIQGAAPGIYFDGYDVRPAKEEDLAACNDVCVRVHGHDRNNELLGTIRNGTAQVVEHEGKISGYTSQLGFFGHTVAETNNDLKALIGAATSFSGPGFLLPSRNFEILVWCLNNGLRIIQPMTLMSKGFYKEPVGAFLPSVLY